MIDRSALFIGLLALGGVQPVFAQNDVAPVDSVQTEHITFAPEVLEGGEDVITLPDPAQPVALPELEPYRLKAFTRDLGKAKGEVALLATMIAATRVPYIVKKGQSFRFTREGWFGRNTKAAGMDKMHHAWKTFVYSDLLTSAIKRRTGRPRDAAISGGLLSLGLMTYAEVFDGFGKSGFSNEDMAIHFVGTGIGLARNLVPGLRDTIDFRMMWVPTIKGKEFTLGAQLENRKYLLATQLSGIKRFRKSPLRFAELHLGYYARGFTPEAKAAGEPFKRRVFVGVGFNVQELFSRSPKSRAERWAKGAFDYIQTPYTLVH